MLSSVLAVRTLNTSCKTLLHWQTEKEKGNKLALKLIPKWVDIVTKDTALAKVAVMKLDLDHFLLHAKELVEFRIDTTAIQSVQLVASKPDFSAYSKLKQQLKIYEESSSYANRQAGKVARIAVDSRTLVSRLAIRDAAKFAKVAGKEDFRAPKVAMGYMRIKGNSEVTGLLRIAKQVQPAIDAESEAILRGKLIRKKRKAEKASLTKVDKFLNSLVK